MSKLINKTAAFAAKEAKAHADKAESIFDDEKFDVGFKATPGDRSTVEWQEGEAADLHRQLEAEERARGAGASAASGADESGGLPLDARRL